MQSWAFLTNSARSSETQDWHLVVVLIRPSMFHGSHAHTLTPGYAFQSFLLAYLASKSRALLTVRFQFSHELVSPG